MFLDSPAGLANMCHGCVVMQAEACQLCFVPVAAAACVPPGGTSHGACSASSWAGGDGGYSCSRMGRAHRVRAPPETAVTAVALLDLLRHDCFLGGRDQWCEVVGSVCWLSLDAAL